MNSTQPQKLMHPWLSFLVELLTARAGFHIQQQKKD